MLVYLSSLELAQPIFDASGSTELKVIWKFAEQRVLQQLLNAAQNYLA